MLVLEQKSGNRLIQLHHLGKLNLRMHVRNPEPKNLIPNWEKDVDFGHIYFDAEITREVEHDFYYTYELIRGKRDLVEKVSFSRPVRMLGEEYGLARLYALEKRLVPYQHPAVVNYDVDSELTCFNIPSGAQNFFGWDFIKTKNKKSVKREVRDGTKHSYRFLIPNSFEKKVRVFVPAQLFEPLYKWAPVYVLDVLGMVEFDLFESVPPGYHEYFKPRLSQRLLK